MTDPGLLRFLELVVRELGATDARVELGGLDPEDPKVVFRIAPSGGRVVVVFAEPPKDRAALEARLDALMGPLLGAEHGLGSVPPPRMPPEIAGRRLDDELGRLSERAGARGAVVFDLASPVVWGASRAGTPEIDALLEDAIVRVRDAHADLRPNHTARLQIKDGAECLARPFAGLYVVALAFEGLASELVALGALLHAMPVIERFVLALPPVDPPPGGAENHANAGQVEIEGKRVLFAFRLRREVERRFRFEGQRGPGRARRSWVVVSLVDRDLVFQD